MCGSDYPSKSYLLPSTLKKPQLMLTPAHSYMQTLAHLHAAMLATLLTRLPGKGTLRQLQVPYHGKFFP
eukprot:1156066-Pelagomonas_calceolata.AAC.4